MKEYLQDRGLSYSCAQSNSWYPTKELDGIPRVVVPATNLEGHRFWQARAMVKTLERNRWRSARGRKAGSIVVVWPEDKLTSKTKLVIVEGPMDALAAGTSDHIGLAAMGKINIGAVVNYIIKGFKLTAVFGGRTVIVVPDVDSPEFGAQAVVELAIAEIRAEIRMPEFEDLAGLNTRQRRRLLA